MRTTVNATWIHLATLQTRTKRLVGAFLIPLTLALAAQPAASESNTATPADAAILQRLVAAYPDYLDKIEGGELIWRDGTRMPLGELHTGKPLESWLADPSIRDIFAIPYPTGDATAPAVDEDPGRARPSAIFDKMYGDCRNGEVEKNLVNVRWLPRKANERLRVTRVNGVDRQLAAVSAELDALPASMNIYLVPSAGSYVCRPIAGTNRISAHGHGIAVDIALKRSHYWRWTKPGTGGVIAWHNAIPMEIVRIFEKHGFIWGGRWYHYDTMHFEYRPELLPAAPQLMPPLRDSASPAEH